jgi:hypothetical protein
MRDLDAVAQFPASLPEEFKEVRATPLEDGSGFVALCLATAAV